uniref:Uncharacterized protein n=1 Tax=Romanomermis culicivorax TaxID=13658 RepID=A0A915JM07_ROMCU
MKELVNNSRSIFLYAPSLDEYNLFELEDTAASNDDDDMDKMNLTIQDNIFKQAWNEDYVNNDLGNDEQEDKIFEAESDNDYYNYQGPSIKG